jgi:LacI family transcriptional regulator
MARWAVGTLLDEQLPAASPRRVKIECALIERGSIGPVRARAAAE